MKLAILSLKGTIYYRVFCLFLSNAIGAEVGFLVVPMPYQSTHPA